MKKDLSKANTIVQTGDGKFIRTDSLGVAHEHHSHEGAHQAQAEKRAVKKPAAKAKAKGVKK